MIQTTGYIQQVPNKSSQCPHCTPKCPHGYPADGYWTYPYYPQVTWHWPINGVNTSAGSWTYSGVGSVENK